MYILAKAKMKKIISNKKDERNIEVEFKLLDLSYIDKIMELQQNIYGGLENKDFYVCSDKEESISRSAGSSSGRIGLRSTLVPSDNCQVVMYLVG